jgi:sugar O-acyltransferase (sialic acid O-acetyltransferase NeuD family)
MSFPIILIGSGGHAKVLAAALLATSVEVLGLTDINPQRWGSFVCGFKVLGDDGILLQYSPRTVCLANGIGAMGLPVERRRVYEKYKALGFTFSSIVHPSAVISSEVELSEGVQVMAGAVIQPGVRIGENSIVNTGATVDHDCEIGPHVHLAPGVALCGGVRVGAGTHIGAGATVIQNVQIGSDSVVGAGAVVLKDFGNQRKVVGVPARECA